VKLCQYNNILFKGNINRDFYLFCLKKDIKLIKFLFFNCWYYILSVLFNSKKNIYEIRKFRYLKEVSNLDKKLREFFKKKDNNNYFRIEPDIVVDKVPKIFIKTKSKSIKKIGYEFDKNYNVDLDKFNDDLLKLKDIESMYLNNKYIFSDVSSNSFYVVKSKKMRYFTRRRNIFDKTLVFGILIVLSFLITCFSFMFTNSYLNVDMFCSYFEVKLFILNFLPVLLTLILLYLITKRLHVTWLITSLVVLIWGVANQTKVYYRDDVVKFEDLRLLKEAIIMGNECDIVIKVYTIIFALLILLIFLVLKNKIKKLSINKIKRVIVIFLVLLFMIFGYKNVYKSKEIYDSVGDLSLINKWIFTRQSQIRGLVYPFIYTLEEGKMVEPNGYDENKVKKILDEYEEQNIPSNKKVNIIAIMLEAYNDFSKFEEIELNEDIYKYFHRIQKKSISGTLVTNIFGGGTINTERNFLTGYKQFGTLRKRTNSYVWYFKEQGYRTEAMHPIYGAFYNRSSINLNLGFDVYYNYENKFSKLQSDFVDDNTFFDSIIDGYEKSVEDGIPYFNFSVTYQNHVPYNDQSYDGKEYYFENDGMDEGLYNQINEYLYGIKRTNSALNKLVNYFDDEKEPVIIVFFGDHNPALGDNALGYHELGINIDLSNVEGFLNYYQTPYVIHANDVAKDMFDNDFIGEGNNISPIFLMNELFENMKLKGNSYLQYMSNLKEDIDVIHNLYCKNDGEFISSSSDKCKKLIDEYNGTNYYMLNSR